MDYPVIVLYHARDYHSQWFFFLNPKTKVTLLENLSIEKLRIKLYQLYVLGGMNYLAEYWQAIIFQHKVLYLSHENSTFLVTKNSENPWLLSENINTIHSFHFVSDQGFGREIPVSNKLRLIYLTIISSEVLMIVETFPLTFWCFQRV